MCRNIIIILSFCIMLSAQEAPERELIVWLKNGLLEITEQKQDEWRGKINADTINTILSKHEIEAIICPFPDYDPSDTLRIMPNGNTHRLINLREVCHIRLRSPLGRDSLLQELSTLHQIRLVEKPIQMILHSTIPNDSLFSEQWALRNTGQAGGQAGFDIKATEAWDYWKGSSSTIIAILEPGVIDRTHEDLAGKVIGDLAPRDVHTTAVASIAAANTNNDHGIAGVDWHATLLSKLVNPNYPDYFYARFIEAVDEGAKILNNSWGYGGADEFSQLVGEAFVYAYLNDCVSIASSGNDGQEQWIYPAGFDDFVFAVGGVKNNGAWTPYSDFGWHIDAVAPAGEHFWPNLGPEDIKACSLKHGNISYYRWFGGTSAAAPHVSGLASLIKSKNPNLHNDDIYWIMRYSATDMGTPGPDKYHGYGLINVLKALKYTTLPYECWHYTATGGSDESVTDWYISQFPYRSLEPGQGGWRVKRHLVVKVVPLTQDVYDLKIWGNKMSTGWSRGDERDDGKIFQWEIGWCKRVMQDDNSAWLITYVYEVQKVNIYGSPYGPIEWWPTTPGNIVYGYTIFGRKTIEAPSGLTGISTVNSIRLQWQDNSTNELGFKIEVKGGQWSNWTLTDSVGQNVAMKNILKNFTEGTIYRFRIFAYAQEFTSSYSDILDVMMLKSPTNLTIVDQPTPISVKIYWQDNSQIEAGFQIARATDGVWNEDYADTFPNITEYIDTVTFLHKYHYKVRVYDSQEHCSEWSNVVEFTPGMLALSDFPQMSAFNNQIKTTVGSDGKIHLINYNGEKMYYTFSNDQGLNFDPWQYLYVDPQYPVDTTPGFALNNNDIPYVVFGGSEWVYGTNYKVRYYVLEIEFPLSYPTMFYESDITTQTSRPTPPSITFAGDDCYIAFKHFNGSIIVAGPYGTPHTTISNWGYFPSIGYDESGNRLVVVVLPDICLAPQVFWRTIGSQIWHQTDIELPYDDMWGMGAPSLWVGQNELRVAFEAETLLSHNQPLPTDTFLYCVPFKWDSYENTYTAKPREKIGPSDADNNCIEGYSSFASKDVVLWKHRDDIWYSQKAGAMWTTPKNISDTPEPDEISSYPQGVVFGGGTRRKLFSLWTEKDGDDYHLARKVVNLPWAYPYVDVALSDIPEATGYNNSQRLLRDANNVLQLAFTSNDNVYHTSLQDTAWSEPVLVGRGKYPSLSLGADGKIYCTYSFHGYRKFGGLMYYVEYLMTSTYDGEDWSDPSILFHTYGSFLWGVGAPSMVVSDTMAYVTFKSYHGPHPHPAPGSVPPHIIVVEGPALIYGKFPVNNASTFTYEIIDTIIKDQIEVDTLTYRNSLVPLLISPSLAVDLEDVKHILWEGDSTQMRYYTIIDTSMTCEFFDSEVDYPWLTMNGDRIDLFWTTRDSIRYRYGWTGTPNLSSSQTVATCESPISSDQYLTWTKQSGDLSYLYCGAIPASDAIASIEVDYSTNLISYPQILYNPQVSNEPASIDLVWTDYDYLGSIGYIYHLNLPIEEPAPTYTFDMGTETPVPVIVQRHGYLALGPEDYQTFDYDSTELIYRMTLHSPHKKYKIRWTYYHEEPGKLKLQFNIDDILHHNRWVEPGEIVTEDAWLPQACLNDNEITIKVKRLSGTIAVLSGLEIEMHEVGGGGPQSAGIQPIKRFFFESMYPNPTKGVLKIRFNSPDERKVTVKMYDVVGRLAETIFNGKAKIGMNEFLIMPKELSVGVYFVRLKTEAYTKTEKVILLR